MLRAEGAASVLVRGRGARSLSRRGRRLRLAVLLAAGAVLGGAERVVGCEGVAVVGVGAEVARAADEAVGVGAAVVAFAVVGEDARVVAADALEWQRAINALSAAPPSSAPLYGLPPLKM